MNVFLQPKDGGARIACVVPFAEADHCVPTGPCPACKRADTKLAGSNVRYSADDRAYESDAKALCCGAWVGTLRAEPSTLFGVREDSAVLLNGRCRVY